LPHRGGNAERDGGELKPNLQKQKAHPNGGAPLLLLGMRPPRQPKLDAPVVSA